MSLERTHESQLAQQIQEKHKVRDEMKGILNQSAQDELAHKQQMDEYVSWQRQEERRKRDLYRQMLDTQIAYSNQMKAYGNMTHIEKQLNKPDLKVLSAPRSSPLQAYKHYDSNQYALLLPGMVNAKSKDSPPRARPYGDKLYDGSRNKE